MNKSAFVFNFLFLGIGAVGGIIGFKYFSSHLGNSGMTETEARSIAEKSCIKGGKALAAGMYNAATKTWWFEANLNAVREGCNPACVVSEETESADINWRCTGLVPPSDNQIAETCEVANCHGLEIECGKPIEMCTMIYQLGDRCRQYAKCGMVNGNCRQIENTEFNTCKSCAQKCEKEFSGDPDKAISCESKCGG